MCTVNQRLKIAMASGGYKGSSPNFLARPYGDRERHRSISYSGHVYTLWFCQWHFHLVLDFL
jgi:hypothetical protein